MRILHLLNRRVGCSRDIAEELGAEPGDVEHHLGVLHDCGTIELVRTERSGGVEHHFYRGMTRIELFDEEWLQVPEATRRTVVGVALDQVSEDVAGAAAAGGFDRDDVHVSLTRFDLDEQGYRELTDLLVETVEWAMAIQSESIARRAAAAGTGEQVQTELVMLHFLPAGTKAPNAP
jgi:hypothetical protein